MSQRPKWIARDRWEECLRKDPLFTEENAERMLTQLRAREDTVDPERLRVYECRFGAHYHVGHIRKEVPCNEVGTGSSIVECAGTLTA